MLPVVSDLTDHTRYWLRMVSNAVSQEFARKVAGEDVTVAERTFMRALFNDEGVAPTALADSMGMARGAISKLADRLTTKGLVMRTGSATEKRGQSLSLTPEGREKVPILARLADLNDAEYFSELSGEERDALDWILRALVERRGLTATRMDMKGAHDRSLSFPEFVGKLIAVGFEGYAVGYRRDSQAFYLSDGYSGA